MKPETAAGYSCVGFDVADGSDFYGYVFLDDVTVTTGASPPVPGPAADVLFEEAVAPIAAAAQKA